ncbi:MAG: hypothetical protein AB7V50_04745, partial [Vampirovibrionia bacterium]
MFNKLITYIIFLVMVVFLVSCDVPKQQYVKRFNLDSLQGLLLKKNVDIDKNISSDGNGSLRITATEPVKLTLFEVNDIDVSDANLIYKAKIRTQDLEGDIYLEMWCMVNGKGPFFSRSLVSPPMKKDDWQDEETPFILERGQTLTQFRLNI